MYYLWIKALHIAFMVTWFAGLFYLPRLFIYHVQAADIESRERFTVMERRLFIIMTIGAALTWLFGLALVVLNTAVAQTTWFSVKFAAVIGLVIYHYRCWLWIRRLRETTELQETRWLRWFNEVPTIFLLLIIILAVVKPG
jgi:putative membrane protein